MDIIMPTTATSSVVISPFARPLSSPVPRSPRDRATLYKLPTSILFAGAAGPGLLLHSKHSFRIPPAPSSTPVRAEAPSDGHSTSVATSTEERSEADQLVDGMTFGQLCDEFQCISSPSVEATARQLARDILEMRDGNRALGSFALFVKYKGPLRSFTGREKYKRSSWINRALDNPSVAIREMAMQSTSLLNIKWTVRGRPRPPASYLGGDLVLDVSSTFTLNQISGQVIDHVEEWDITGSSAIGQAYFWASRLVYVTGESGRDAAEAVLAVSKLLEKGKDEDRPNIYADPSGDPTKFFQTDDNPQRDIYQVGLFLALIYLVVQFLKSTL